MVLQDNGGDDLTSTGNGPSTFAGRVASDATYLVTARNEAGPIAGTRTVTSRASSVGAGNVTNVTVGCAPTAFTLGGTVSGLLSGQSLVLEDNSTDNLTVKSGVSTSPSPPGWRAVAGADGNNYDSVNGGSVQF